MNGDEQINRNCCLHRLIIRLSSIQRVELQNTVRRLNDSYLCIGTKNKMAIKEMKERCDFNKMLEIIFVYP